MVKKTGLYISIIVFFITYLKPVFTGFLKPGSNPNPCLSMLLCERCFVGVGQTLSMSDFNSVEFRALHDSLSEIEGMLDPNNIKFV